MVGFMNERTIRARDGRRYTVRPMTTDDADVVIAGFASLSPESHRSRFFGAGPGLTRAVRDDLVRVDDSRVVLLAFDEGGRLVGGARAIRHRDDPATADVAVTVGDAYHRQGIGSKLLKVLGAEALAVGIDRLAGHVLVDNPGARGLLIANGAMVTFAEPGVLAFEIPLGRHRRVTPAVAARPRLGLAS
jgi:GNAT superfamily N-acetyltransferase